MSVEKQIQGILGDYKTKSQNEWILVLLLTAPETQLATPVKDMCQNTLDKIKADEFTPEELRDFLVEDIYKSCCASSSFIKAMVMPEYIKREDYMRSEEE